LAYPALPSAIRGDLVVLRFGRRSVPRSLRHLPVRDIATATEIDTAIQCAGRPACRLIVAGGPADLAAVLTRLLRIGRLDIEVAYLTRRFGAARRARSVAARRVPLVRDETGQVVVGAAYWLPPHGAPSLRGEGVVDDTVLFDGDVPAVKIEPTMSMPGLRARVQVGRLRRGSWVSGRAAQLGTTGAQVVRDGIPADREVARSTFYRHTQGWLRVR
jgi:hypothetical protein